MANEPAYSAAVDYSAMLCRIETLEKKCQQLWQDHKRVCTKLMHVLAAGDALAEWCEALTDRHHVGPLTAITLAQSLERWGEAKDADAPEEE